MCVSHQVKEAFYRSKFTADLAIYSCSGFPSLVRNHDVAAAAAAAAAASKSRQRVGGESVRQSQRASVRQSEASYHFRDIALRKFNNFTQIILSPSTTKMKNALNSRVS